MENNSVKLGDDSIKVVLNTKGKDPKGVNNELIELLKYFHNSTKETAEKASSDFVKRLDKMLEPIKNSSKFGGEFMSIQEKIYTEKKISREEGIQIGEKKGKEEGIQEMLEKMRKSGMSEEQIKLILAN